MRRLSFALLVCFIAAACTPEVTGPEPQMADDPGELSTDPAFFCNEDPGTWITLTGEAFSPLVIDTIATEEDHDVELPTVTLRLRKTPTGEDAQDSHGVTLDSPLGAEDGDVRWLDGETMQFRVSDELDLPPGVYDITVENPNGETSTDHEAIGVLPRPVLEPPAVPELTCVAQGERSVVLEGEHFLVSGDDLPTVYIDGQDYEVTDVDDCHGLHDVFGDHELCAEATALIDEDSLAAGTYDVTIENLDPAGCESRPEEDDTTLTIADPPEVHDIQPSPICSEQLDYQTVDIDGEGFVTLGTEEDTMFPEVRIGDQTYQPEGADGCEPVGEAPSMDAERCSQLTVSISAGDFADAVEEGELVTQVDVIAENPDPVGCHSTEDTTLGVAPPPQVTAVEPRAFCNNDGTVGLDVDGDHLFEIDGVAPTVVIDGKEYDTSPQDCSDVDGEEGTRHCESLDVDIDPADLDGAHSLTAVNPEPMACESADSEEFYAAGPPVIDSADPDGFCEDAEFDGELELFGQFLNDPESESQITVEVGGESVDFELAGCAQAVADYDLELCGSIKPDIPTDLRDDLAEEDDFMVTVTGADPVACGDAQITLERTEPPTINNIVPLRVCADGGTTFTVTGTGIHDEAEFFLDSVRAADEDVEIVDDTEAIVTFNEPIPGSSATFEVINPGDCGTAYDEEEILVTDGPLPVFVDPPVVFDGMNTQVTIYAAGLFGGEISEVELIHPDGTTTLLEASAADRPSIMQATIPEGVLDDLDEADFNEDGTSADFGIRLTDDEISCSNEADDLVTITEELTIALDEISPPFGAQDQATGVEIFAATDLAEGETQFEATPRAYLNPASEEVGTLGREIRAIQFIDETELNGIVPSDLPVGFYDLIVVNPDGAVGVLDDAFQITEERPPLIDGVSPGSWPFGRTVDVEVEGENFRDDPTVEVFCQQVGDTETDEALLDQPANIDVISVTDTLVELEVNTDGLDASACYMRLTNTDGTYGEYSPIAVTNPAENFITMQDGTALDNERRSPTAFAGSATRTARYLYVVGGDDGDRQNAFTSGEFTRLDRFGAPSNWNSLTYELPSGRSFAGGARIDDFLYLVGGHDADEDVDGPAASILRAQILDPLDTPEIVAVDLDVEEFLEQGEPETGLDAGTYYYRVSALYRPGDTGDEANPGGESLASEPQPIQLPVDGVTLTISWEPPEDLGHDIVSYNIYRNVDPDDPYGNESLIANVDAAELSFTDDGELEPIDGDNPLPQGSLGQWHEVGQLNVARDMAGVTVAASPDPEADDEYYVYAIGGEDDQNQLLDSYEYFLVDVEGPRQQDVFAPTIVDEDLEGGELVLDHGRKGLTAAIAYDANSSAVAESDAPPQILVYGGESDAGGQSDAQIEVTTVTDDGQLNPWSGLGTMGGNDPRQGHAGAVLNNYLVYVGGSADGSAGDSGRHSELQCGGDCPPDPVNLATTFPSLGGLEMDDQAWMGHIPFRGFWYLTGGIDDTGAPTDMVQYSVAGATP